MRVSSFFGLGLVSLVLPALAEPHARSGRRHSELARRANGDLSTRDTHTNARFSFYATGLGSCGITNNDNDFIVALNADEYGSGYPGPNCFKMITISYGGKTTQAQITDRCPGCPYGGLDMSPGLFQYFAAESVGIIYGTWYYTSDGDSSTPTTSSKYVAPTTSSVWTPDPTTSTSVWVAPTTSSTWKAETTTSSSTWVAPTTSSTPTPDPTTSKAAASSSAQQSSSAAQDAAQSSSAADLLPSGSASSASPSGTAVVSNDAAGSNLASVNDVVLGIANLAAAGPAAS